MTLSRYVCVDTDDHEHDILFDTYAEALAYAEQAGCAVVEYEYEFSDSNLVWTPNGESTWPPT